MVLPRRNPSKVPVRYWPMTLPCQCYYMVLSCAQWMSNGPFGNEHWVSAKVCASTGFFQQDDQENYFVHFRPTAWCNYFVTKKDVFAKITIDVCDEDDLSEVSNSHVCDPCKETGVTEQEFELLSDLPEARFFHNPLIRARKLEIHIWIQNVIRDKT